MAATVLRLRAFGLPDGDCRAESADAKTQDEAADGELREAEGCTLEDFADPGEGCGEEDSSASSEGVTDPGAGQRSEEGAECACRNNDSLDIPISNDINSTEGGVTVTCTVLFRDSCCPVV